MTLTIGSEVELSCVPGFKCRGDVYANLPGWLDLGFGNAPAFDVQIQRFDKVFDPRHHGKLIDPPQNLAKWLGKLPGITVDGPAKRVSVGGLDAIQLDVRTGDRGVSLAPIPDLASPASFGFGPHDARRVIAVDVDGHQLLIVVGVVSDVDGVVVTPADLKPATDFMQPLIDSIEWQ